MQTKKSNLSERVSSLISHLRNSGVGTLSSLVLSLSALAPPGCAEDKDTTEYECRADKDCLEEKICVAGYCDSQGKEYGCVDNDKDGNSGGEHCPRRSDCVDDNPLVKYTIWCEYDGEECGSFDLCVESCPTYSVEIPNRENSSGKIAFFGENGRYHRPGIYVMNADGSDLRNLTRNSLGEGGYVSSYIWSPDGTRIAFRSDTDHIYVMDSDGSNLRELIQEGQGESYLGSWSPDGKQIAFWSYAEDDDGEIYLINDDGNNKRRLTDNTASDSSPSWSPDGTKIAFDSDRDGHRRLYVMNADGSDQRLINSFMEDPTWTPRDFEWSPDGRKIVFESSRKEQRYDHPDWMQNIYVMNIDGTNLKRLTDSGAGDFNPSWSPDGKRIAFMSERHGPSDVYTINPLGCDEKLVVDGISGESIDTPKWSPDGTRIAFGSDRDGDSEIYVINADGSNLRQLTNNTTKDTNSSWAPR